MRLKEAASTLADLSAGAFRPVLGDASVESGDVTRLVLCSGKVYYDLAQAREARQIRDVAILRLEQLYPWNEELANALAPYKDGTKLYWVQEEPRNYGPWYYINANLPNALHHRFPLSCVSRAPSASSRLRSGGRHRAGAGFGPVIPVGRGL